MPTLVAEVAHPPASLKLPAHPRRRSRLPTQRDSCQNSWQNSCWEPCLGSSLKTWSNPCQGSCRSPARTPADPSRRHSTPLANSTEPPPEALPGSLPGSMPELLLPAPGSPLTALPAWGCPPGTGSQRIAANHTNPYFKQETGTSQNLTTFLILKWIRILYFVMHTTW